MAINTNTGDSSPRISFSSDLREANSSENPREAEVIRLDTSLLLNSNSDFNFCVTTFPDTETYCPADELFCNGMIIPTQMKQKLNSINKHSKEEEEEEKEEEEEITASTTATLIREEKTQSKSIWSFKRSSSVNCDNYGYKKSSIWSLPLLFRSKSTGSSSANPSDDNSKQNQKTSKLLSNPGKRLTCSSSHQKPPLKKSGSNNGGSVGVFAKSYTVNNNYNNGVRNSHHVLNVPSPYIAKGTSDLLGFTTLFRNVSMDKRSKK